MKRAFATRGLLLCTAALMAPLLSGCTGKLDRSQELLHVLQRTASLSRHFTYTEVHAGHATRVVGNVADDLRYSVDMTVDGKPAVSEVMRDDARALRFDPSWTGLVQSSQPAVTVRTNVVTNPGAAAQPSASPSPGTSSDEPVVGVSLTKFAQHPISATTLTALQGGKWVVDPTGAGPIGRLQHLGTLQELGKDPVLDALSLFQRVHDLVQGGASVETYNPEAIDYRKDLDPFAPPGAGEVRYDVQSASLPPRVSTVGTSPQQREQAVPGESYFSALSVYVKNGLAVRVAESVNVKRRLIADPDQDVLARLADAGVNVPAAVLSGSADTQARFIEKSINSILARRGASPLRQRELNVELSDLNQPIAVDLPSDAVTGNLAGVLVRGQILAEGGQ